MDRIRHNPRLRPRGPKIAVVGGDSLLAQEIRELMQQDDPAPDFQLLSTVTDGSALLKAALSAEEHEPVVLTPLTAEGLDGCSAAFLAGSAASSRRAQKLNPPDGPPLIDLTGSLDEHPGARLRAPSAEPPDSVHALGGSKPKAAAAGEIAVIAHPAAIALAVLLSRLAVVGAIRRSVVHVLEPASERGQQGIEELRKQTVSVLSFQKLDTDVFDTQLAFNLLPRYGEEAMEPLESIEERMERHLASLLAAWPDVPMPSVRLIQAPVFHGHSISVWVEFAGDVAVGQVPAMLAEVGRDAGIEVRGIQGEDGEGDGTEPPTNVGIAGQSGLSVGAITPDRNHSRACWIWLVTDNLRLAAENAVAVLREWE